MTMYSFRIVEDGDTKTSRCYRVGAGRRIPDQEKVVIEQMRKSKFLEYAKENGWTVTEID